MEDIKKQITELKVKLYDAAKQIRSDEDLECFRITFSGRSGLITSLMNQLKKLPVEEKRVIGPLLNELKQIAEQQYEHATQELLQKRLCHAAHRLKHFDVTITKKPEAKGSLHIYTKLLERIEDIFITMGFAVADGPEVETEYYNFDALNVPENHPARDMQDTVWLSNTPNTLLRTHTSPVQIRMMEEKGAPLAIIAPGRVYRHESTDATHDYMFTQVEGLFIDKNVSLSNLLATAKCFFQQFFERSDLDIRVRPGYFPFVEPGIEIDFSCPFCKSGCSICKRTGWIELIGAGMVHPYVLQCGGIDPDKYSGFAFGFGLERLAMMKYNIPDVRLFKNAKISTLDQF